jgi:Tol biopolymer transport system component
MIVPVMLGFGLYAFTTQAEEVPDPDATPTTSATATDTATSPDGPAPTDTPTGYDDFLTQQAAPPATPTPGVERRGDFHDGAWVRVNAGAGDCLNARNSPSLEGDWVIVNICVPDGHEGMVSGMPQQADGHWWWYIAGLGWMAEDYLLYVGEFDARTNVLAELGGAEGRVAFLRGNDVWMMRPDGSGQVLLLDNPDPDGQTYVPGPAGLAWSPDGTRLSYNVGRWDPDGIDPPSVDLHILTVDEAGLVAPQVFEGLAGGGWSPDGVHLGVIRQAEPPQMGGGMTGIPAVLEVNTGSQLVLGSEPFYQEKPPAFNHDGTLLMVNQVIYRDTANSIAIVIYAADGAEHDRIEFGGELAGYASPAWSPTGNKIAMHLSRAHGDRYTSQYEVYDVDTGTFSGGGATPKVSERIGGRCGGGDMWSTAWSADGSRVLYSFTWGDTGANGIWSWDPATGAQSVVYAANAGAPSSGRAPGEGYAARAYVMFSSGYQGSFIFLGTHLKPENPPRIVTDGSSPVWYVPR